MPVIRLETQISAPLERVFDLARSIDLHKLSATGTNEEAISGKISGLIELNETVTWRAKHLGFYQNLTVKISQFERPSTFTDTMLKGAFASMKHTHQFKISGNGTKMTDIFEYKSPLGLFGKIADIIFLENYMRKFLITRNKELKTIAEGDSWETLI